MEKYGLIGKNIEFSFSRKYFAEKFKKENLNAEYINFDCQNIEGVKKLLEKENQPNGYNVTIPYKQAIMPFLQEINKHAQSIGAVNTIKRLPDGRLKGYNTDYLGFRKAIRPLLGKTHQKALILGTGGSSKAIAYALELEDINYDFVSRTPNKEQLGYDQLNAALLSKYTIIVNCTPLGTYPAVDKAPPIPYHLLSAEHLLFDLVYNPEETKFMKEGAARGALTTNGFKMLQLQAEAAWGIWN